jgi:hypothetical protein
MTYGSLVDCLLTEPSHTVHERFILVKTKVKVEDALKYENQKQEFLNKIEEVKNKKSEKIKLAQKDLNDAVFEGKPAKTIASKEKAYAKAQETGKADAKSIEASEKKIAELENKLTAIKSIGTRAQVTESIWKNAEETVLAIKSHPYFANLVFDEFTSQQIFTCTGGDLPRKGKLDHLKLSPEIDQLYKMYKAKLITQEAMQENIKKITPNNVWAVITDIKTCFDLAKLEPYNNHYRGQLGFYQDLVSEFFGLPTEKVFCQILVGDKVSSQFKKAELFGYHQSALDELKPDIYAWMQIWKMSYHGNKFTSAKEKYGMEQKCFTCTECRNSPFSMTPGQPVIISAPRFGGVKIDPSSTEVEDLLLDY